MVWLDFVLWARCLAQDGADGKVGVFFFGKDADVELICRKFLDPFMEWKSDNAWDVYSLGCEDSAHDDVAREEEDERGDP